MGQEVYVSLFDLWFLERPVEMTTERSIRLL